MYSFFIAIMKGEECVAADQVVTTVQYLGMLLKSSLIICEYGNPDDYQIDAIINFGSKDPFKSREKSFYPDDIRSLAEAARFVDIEYDKELNKTTTNV